MRIILFFVFALSFLHSGPLKSQDYTPFNFNNSVWIIHEVLPKLGPGDDHNYWEYYTTHDSLINDRNYTLLRYQKLCHITHDQQGVPTYTTYFPNSDRLIGGLREESKRIYFQTLTGYFEGEYANKEYLLYDFNFSVGDTLHFDTLSRRSIINGDTTYSTYFSHTIINSELSPEQNKKQYEVTPNSTFNYPLETGKWAEGIGSSFGLFGSYNSYLRQLTCYKNNNDTIIFMSECAPCGVNSASTVSEANPSIRVFPNPVSEVLNIHSNAHPIVNWKSSI